MRSSPLVFHCFFLTITLDYRFDTFCELAAWHEDFAPATKAPYSNICAQSDHTPLEATARVWLSHVYYVVQANIGRVNHCSCCSRGP